MLNATAIEEESNKQHHQQPATTAGTTNDERPTITLFYVFCVSLTFSLLVLQFETS
jgi:hypothetical protein